MFNILSIIFGISLNHSFNLIGQFYYVHLVLIFIFIFLFIKNKILFEPRNLFIIGFLWFLNQALSDFINETEFENYIRGLAKIFYVVFALFIFLNLENLKKNNLYILLFWSSLITSIYFFLSGYENIKINWKYYEGHNLLILILVFLHLRNVTLEKLNFFHYFLFIFLAVLSLFWDTRSLFLFISLLIIHCFLLNSKFLIKKIEKNIIFFFLCLFAFLFVISISYEFLYDNNLLPYNVISRQQGQEGNYGILIGGRTEIISAIKAIIDKPFLGHGSWAKDCFYIDYLQDFLSQNNYQKKLNLSKCLIPTHSLITGSWVYSGIFGMIFWLYILYKLIKEYIYEIKNRSNESLLKFYIIIFLTWEILFSGLMGITAITSPLLISIILKKNQ